MPKASLRRLPYIQRFRGQTFVVKYGGAAMEEDQIVDRFLRDIVFLEAVGINPVLVHGGGKVITARMREAGLKPQFVNGLRVTDEQSISIVEETLDNEINPKIVDTIVKFGGKAQGILRKIRFYRAQTSAAAQGEWRASGHRVRWRSNEDRRQERFVPPSRTRSFPSLAQSAPTKMEWY